MFYRLRFRQILHFFENLYPDIPYSSNMVLKVSQPGLIFFPALLNLFYRYHVGRNKPWITSFYLVIPIVLTVVLFSQKTRSDILFITKFFHYHINFIYDLIYL